MHWGPWWSGALGSCPLCPAGNPALGTNWTVEAKPSLPQTPSLSRKCFTNIYTGFIYWGSIIAEKKMYNSVGEFLVFLISVCFPSALLSYPSLSHTHTHIHTTTRWRHVCVQQGESVLAPLIHFTPHWSETCDCGSGLCLFLTPWESTGVRGHMQEKHTQTFMHTHKHTVWPLNIL